MLIHEALAQARAAGVARLDAQWLLGHLLSRPRSWLLAHGEEALPEAARATWPALLARRAGGEPLAYVLGEHEFCGLALTTTPAVLVPRPETELLVQWALELLIGTAAPSVIDLGTGSGAIALALLRARPDIDMLATDASAEALCVAQGNAQRHAMTMRVAQGNWWAATGSARFSLAVSNPPYIAAGDPHLPALVHEPLHALASGQDGLDALRQLIVGAPEHLLPGAWLLVEHGHDQANSVQSLLRGRGFSAPQTRHDLADLPRCTGARWPAAN